MKSSFDNMNKAGGERVAELSFLSICGAMEAITLKILLYRIAKFSEGL